MERYPDHYEQLQFMHLRDRIEQRLQGKIEYSGSAVRNMGEWISESTDLGTRHLSDSSAWVSFALFKLGYRLIPRWLFYMLPEEMRPKISPDARNHYIVLKVDEENRYHLVDANNFYGDSSTNPLLEICRAEGLLEAAIEARPMN